MPADQAATEHKQPAAAQASPQGLAGGTGRGGRRRRPHRGGAGMGGRWRRSGQAAGRGEGGAARDGAGRRLLPAACCQGFGDLEKLGLESEVADFICHVVGLGWRNNVRASLIGPIPYLLKTG